MNIFISQLFHLLGVPSSASTGPTSTLIKVDSLTRIQILKNLKESKANLHSLIKLSESLNEITIPEETKTMIDLTLDKINQAIAQAKDIHKSMEFSAQALIYSNKAFFEEKMVQQAYFPNEHKLAVLLPLLGPVCSIMIFGSLKLVKDLKSLNTVLKKKKDE
ncbi:uncharacterized protein J8A68_001506 [[Candida] subhashii]|uniref:Uncharacterized protein n=1 Tax=[Candida] subhashii TaxID=561895 RepID=A0A8J5QN84_9ASCO|nr:uncharacterized protein J8A68_001506 [[Candida] subhashii]KAG7664978.1 hypothetical protein J8A68_001506 [[Candida] subhashii]